MQRGKSSAEQMISILKQLVGGRAVAEVCREQGVNAVYCQDSGTKINVESSTHR